MKEFIETTNRSIIEIVDQILKVAESSNASDVHLSPTKEGLWVRFRIDGVLQNIALLPKNTHQEIISRIKVIARLRTDEHHTPQDGRFGISLGEIFLNIRVSIAPTHYGENVVMRLLSDHTENLNLENLGFSTQDKLKLEKASRSPYGMILVSGPTGSGKTTTLYTLLKKLNSSDVSIITIEDPIEYAIDGINQMQVNNKAGLSFSSGLRSMLRQDPDIIMVGEIRDQETARLAVNTALTGHLVLSTIHSNDAHGTITRLQDLSVENFLICSTVNLIISQRLVRKICTHCKVQYFLNESEIQNLVDSSVFKEITDLNLLRPFFKGKGCEKCVSTGYKGRIGIYEIISMNGPLRESILLKKSAEEIKKQAKDFGYKTITEDGFLKACEGITTLEEILRVTHE